MNLFPPIFDLTTIWKVPSGFKCSGASFIILVRVSSPALTGGFVNMASNFRFFTGA